MNIRKDLFTEKSCLFSSSFPFIPPCRISFFGVKAIGCRKCHKSKDTGDNVKLREFNICFLTLSWYLLFAAKDSFFFFLSSVFCSLGENGFIFQNIFHWLFVLMFLRFIGDIFWLYHVTLLFRKISSKVNSCLHLYLVDMIKKYLHYSLISIL